MHGSGGQSEADINLTPLLDVVLQLIMFFMITANLAGMQAAYPGIRLPIAQALVPKDKEDEERERLKEKIDDQIYVNVNADNEIVGIVELGSRDAEGRLIQTRERIKAYFDDRMTLARRKAQKEGRQPKVILILRADKEARYHKIFDILEAGRLVGIEDYRLHGMTFVEKKH